MDLRHAFLFLLSILFSQSSMAQADFEDARFFAVPLKSLELLSLTNRPEILKTNSELALVKLNRIQTDELSKNLHASRPGCGGFADIQVLMEKYGVDVTGALNMEANPENLLRKFDKSEPTYPDETKKVLMMANAPRLWDFLTTLSSFPNRSAYSEEGVKAALWLADYGSKLAQSHGRTDIEVLSFPTGGFYKQPSIAIRIKGKNPQAPGVLIGGHMDTFDNIKPGADDDGSGTATVMEVYNAVLDSGIKFERDVYFAFYAAEERGLVGSKVMVAEFKKRGIPVRAILQLDMTGFKSPKDNQEIYMIQDRVNPELTQFISRLTEVYVGIPVTKIGKTQCGYGCSDHASWTAAGYDSAFPFEASFDNDNKTIHTEKDRMDILSIDHAAKFMRLAAAFVVETADPVK